jgi:FAD/FMN-containing dehydrogenase
MGNSSPPARLGRRRVLAGIAAIAAGGVLARVSLPAPAFGRTVVRGPSEAAWRHLADQLSGPLLRSTRFNLSKIARPYNLRYAADLPSAIALCRSAEDVAAAILWCRDNQIPLVVQGGGHSYGGYSMRRGGLMINLLLMREARFSNGTVTVGGGVRNHALYALLEQHDIAIPHGRCPSVGIGGFLLGGGIGFNMRRHGLACDQLLASDIVTAEGDIRTIKAGTEGTSADLFWACRGGGGGNFGVNTAFTLQPFEARPVTVFDLTWHATRPNPSKVFAKLMQVLDAAPGELGTRILLKAPSPRARGRGGDVTINLLGQLHGGSGKKLDDLLADVFALAVPQHTMTWEELRYWDAQKLLEDNDPPTCFQERSALLRSALDEDALGLAFQYLRAWPGTDGAADLRFFQTGGKMNAVAADATAFVHRQSRWLLDIGLSWSAMERREVVARSRAWQDRFYEAMRPFSTGGAYQNFADPSLQDWRAAYYGDNLARLERIKKAVDPDRVFAFAQAL